MASFESTGILFPRRIVTGAFVIRRRGPDRVRLVSPSTSRNPSLTRSFTLRFSCAARTFASPYDPNGTPGVLRPSQFRVVVDSNNPLSPSGSGNVAIWHGAVASSGTSGPVGNDAGWDAFRPDTEYGRQFAGAVFTRGKILDERVPGLQLRVRASRLGRQPIAPE
jgi:hypothetical protein